MCLVISLCTSVYFEASGLGLYHASCVQNRQAWILHIHITIFTYLFSWYTILHLKNACQFKKKTFYLVNELCYYLCPKLERLLSLCSIHTDFILQAQMLPKITASFWISRRYSDNILNHPDHKIVIVKLFAVYYIVNMSSRLVENGHIKLITVSVLSSTERLFDGV